jgi:hypothetical protein
MGRSGLPEGGMGGQARKTEELLKREGKRISISI